MLTHLKLRDFRCFKALALEVAPGVQFFTGDNAQGKTSILEAACVLLRLASPRSSTLLPLVRQGGKGFALEGRWGARQMQFYYSADRRKLVLDGIEQTGTAEFLRAARLVYFSNTDVELVRGAADGRRRFLDFLGSQIEPLYRSNLRGYERALRSRNRLLKTVPARPREIEAYNTPLLETGSLLTDLRCNLVAELQPWAAGAQASIRTDGPSGQPEELSLEYLPGAGEDFAAGLLASREEELRLRQTLVGPHRDDVALRLAGQPAGTYGSEGQQRTLALALKLAQARLIEAVWKQPPLLLLDDIFGELDVSRRNALLAALPANAQQLITTTHLDWLRDAPSGPIWRLRDRVLESTVEG